MDPLDEKQVERLFKAADASYRNLEPFRKLNQALVREHAGSGYGQTGDIKFETMVNLMNQTVDAYTMSLVANRPRVLITTKYPQQKFFAKKFEQALNNLIEEIRLEETLARWVLDAFFGVGIIKIHLADSAPVQMENDTWMDPGIPYASNISLDNFVFDQAATHWKNVRFAADWYRIPFSHLEDGDMYLQDVVKDLRPTSKFDITDDERLERISLGHETDADDFEPMIDLADFWVPSDGKIYTYAIDPVQPFNPRSLADGSSKQAMALPVCEPLEWNGPEFGPYHLLGFGDVPENIMPTSPASHLNSLVKLINNIMRKSSRRAREQKQVNMYTPTGAKTARALKNANDGEWKETPDVNEVKAWASPGVDPQNHTFMLGCMDMFDRMAGNLQAMLGLGPQADTLGQEKLIHGAVSAKEAKMQLKVLGATTRVIRDLGFMLWTDSVKVMPQTYSVPGAPGYELDTTWTPDDREGDFFDYNHSIDIYSMAYRSPEQRAQALVATMTGLILPLEQQIMAQGGVIDIQVLCDTVAELTDQPYLKEIVKFVNIPPDPAETPQGKLPGKAAHTSRTNIRKDAPNGEDGTQAAQSDWANLAGQGAQAGNQVPTV